MRTRAWRACALAVPLLLAGCAGAEAAPQPAAASTPASAAPSAPSDASAPPGTAAPSATAAMVCGEDVVGDVGRVLSLTAPPPTEATWVAPLYTCAYQLPMGPLVLSVQDSGAPDAAARYFAARQAEAGSATPATGLGERAFATPAGTVVVLKDAMTLTVDASGLPAVFGDNGQRRDDFAYEVASVVLGCWTGHE